ncbi:unnamed protein product [Closterium sp. Yama58-4]|nr:unnamed protein product [Closterium sp. Yama58-4]
MTGVTNAFVNQLTSNHAANGHATSGNATNGNSTSDGNATNGCGQHPAPSELFSLAKRRRMDGDIVEHHTSVPLNRTVKSDPDLWPDRTDLDDYDDRVKSAAAAAAEWAEMCDAAVAMEAGRRAHAQKWSRRVREGLAKVVDVWKGMGRERDVASRMMDVDHGSGSGGGGGGGGGSGMLPRIRSVHGDLDNSLEDGFMMVDDGVIQSYCAEEHHHYGPRNDCKTKMICTLGPASRSVPVLEKLLLAGMNVARFNFSHGSHEYHAETLSNLRAAMANTGILCATLLDTKGPEIRTGQLKGGKAVQLQQGSEVTLTTDYATLGDASTIAMSYKSLAKDVRPGGQILCADGSISLTVLSCDVAKGTVRCRCENTAVLGERKNVNLPGVIVDLPTVTAKDAEDILHWAVPHGIDFIAASFVRKGSDVVAIRKLLGPENSKRIHIISKVENQEGLVNFDDILRESDGIMVARGDLGMEIPIEKIFLAQKMMIHKCNKAGKPVVTATQMLESMTKFPRPTRAECTDVANAVLDGTDAVMLSGETAAGQYPVEAACVMVRLCREAEASVDPAAAYKEMMAATAMPMSPIESLASSAVKTADMIRAAVIVVLTRTGATSRLIAKYRPPMPVLSVVVPELIPHPHDPLRLVCCSGAEAAVRHALLVRGLHPVMAEGGAHATDSDATDAIVAAAIGTGISGGLCNVGDTAVVVQKIGNASALRIMIVK